MDALFLRELGCLSSLPLDFGAAGSGASRLSLNHTHPPPPVLGLPRQAAEVGLPGLHDRASPFLHESPPVPCPLTASVSLENPADAHTSPCHRV